LSANFTSKSVFDNQGCRALTFALARLSCHHCLAERQNVSCFLLCVAFISLNARTITTSLCPCWK